MGGHGATAEQNNPSFGHGFGFEEQKRQIALGNGHEITNQIASKTTVRITTVAFVHLVLLNEMPS